MITVFDKEVNAQRVEPEQLENIVEERQALWVHVEGQDYTDFYKVAGAYHIHHLAVDNVTQPFTRSRISRYEEQVLITTEIPVFYPQHRFELVQIAIFVLPEVIITVVNKNIGYDHVIRERLTDAPFIPERTEGFILYAILDCIADNFVKAAELLDEETENLETNLFKEKPDSSIQQLSFFIHRDLTHLRRVIMPMEEVLNTLIRWYDTSDNVQVLPYFQEVYGHIRLAAGMTNASREMVNNILQTNISLQNNAMNATMKKVTGWGAVIAVTAGITGYFGMNVPYPGANQWWGVPLSTGLLITINAALIYAFKKKDWL
ncbi:MAG: magnesium transporter CorA family protein [Micrococcaceae bacterium]